jgi:hypothetical protein
MSSKIGHDWLGGLSVTKYTKEATGFTNPELVTITDNGNRRVTLTGTVIAMWRGNIISAITNGWISPAHPNTVTSRYFLAYNGNTLDWVDMTVTSLDFSWILICYAFHSGIEWVYLNEEHGLMQWQNHKEFHETVGTYLVSGGDLAGLVPNSTTVANRRPTLNATTIQDEDVPTVLPLLGTNSYTWFYLAGAGATVTFTTANAEIINLSTNQPYYNQNNAGTWQQTLFPVNAYGKIFVIAVPVTAGTNPQKYRYLFVQPQTVSTTLSTIQALTPSSLNLSTFSTMSPEFVFIGEIIVRYTAGNWVVTSFAKLQGSKQAQVTVSGTQTYRDGFMDYNHGGSTQAYTTGNLKLLNDGTGANTLKTYKPLGVSEFWNTSTNQFNFSELALGDEITIRFDITITTTATNQESTLFLTCGVGAVGAYNLPIETVQFKSAGTYQVARSLHLYLGNTLTKDNPAEFYFTSDANTTVLVNGFYITVKRRF